MMERWAQSLRWGIFIIGVACFGYAEIGLTSQTQESAKSVNERTIIANDSCGKITLFHQDYSTIKEVPNNVFIQNPLVGPPRQVRAKALYDAKIGGLSYQTLKGQSGALYIAGLVPMVNTRYCVKLRLESDSNNSILNILFGASVHIGCQLLSNNEYRLYGYYYDESNQTDYKTMDCDGNDGILTIFISFDGAAKLITIELPDLRKIVFPFSRVSERLLPYASPSKSYIKFDHRLDKSGTYMRTIIREIAQDAERRLITAIGNVHLLPFGFDGPHSYNKIASGVQYLESRGSRGTIWLDSQIISEQYPALAKHEWSAAVANISALFLRGWEPGIHFSRELALMPEEGAKALMIKEVQDISSKFRKPFSWACLRNNDNVFLSRFLFDKYGILWRNGAGGIQSEPNIGNLDDDNWDWWNSASAAGLIFPCFTHKTDADPAERYSISFSKFTKWVDNFLSHDIKIIGFAEWWGIQANSLSAFFDEIRREDTSFEFVAHTNGYRAWVNVVVNPGNTHRVRDLTSSKDIVFLDNRDGSLSFFTENLHKYFLNL